MCGWGGMKFNEKTIELILSLFILPLTTEAAAGFRPPSDIAWILRTVNL